MTQPRKRIPTNNYAAHYDPSKPHHRAWLQAVLDRVEKFDPDALQEGGDLRSIWVAAIETKAPSMNLFDKLKPLLDLIAAGEGGYTSINRGRAGDTPGGFPGLTAMTISEIQAKQALAWNAVGRYQFIATTLKMAMDAAGISPAARFTPEVQDWLAIALLIGGKRPKLRDYLLGRDVSLDDAQTDLALEWASLPLPNGRGAYDGDRAGNRASGDVAKVRKALTDARRALAGMGTPVLTLPPQQPAKLPPAKPPTRSTPPHLLLTRTRKRDARGLELLRLVRVKNSVPMGELLVVSGAPGAQAFKTGAASESGSLEPLPEGRWGIADILWAGGKDNYNASWGAGLGPASVPLSYQAPGTTRRSAIEAHYDANHGNSPGTAGCVGFRSIEDLKTFIGWLRADDPRLLFVDWGLGTCPPVR
jgi:hypothetical protein